MSSLIKPSPIVGVFHRGYKFSYRVFGGIFLYFVLFCMLAVPALMGFFFFNTSWGAPVIISSSDPASLDLLSKIVESKGAADALTVDCERLRKTIVEMTHHRAELGGLDNQLAAEIDTELADDRFNGNQLAHLNGEKRQDISATTPVIADNAKLRDTVEAELKVGLITKAEAAAILLQIQTANNAFTDGKIAEVLIRDQVRSHTTTDTLHLDTLSKQSELRSEITNLDINIATSENLWRTECLQVERLQQAVATAEQTPQYQTLEHGPITAMFLPYGTSAVVGSRVMDCHLGIVACYQVGSVTQLFSQEVQGQTPLLRTVIRGTLVQIQLDPKHQSAALEKILYIEKPVGI